jgi:pimeloyl-ACP methyl ester carboxylesterase
MATILSMPKWGLAMKTGLVVAWLKQPGATVQEGEPIVEIESEKATNEVDAPASGMLRWIEVPEGDKAPVGAALAVIAAPGEELSDEQVAALLREDAEIKRLRAAVSRGGGSAPPAPARTGGGSAPPAPTRAGGRVNASPAARRLAQELGVALAALTGTGPGGIIGREDVLRAAQAQSAGEESEERTVMVNGFATHCLLAGPRDAPHVVFIHGLGGSLATFALNLPAFAEKFRLCALDLVGAGDSDKAVTDYSIPTLADFLARFLDALGPDWRRASLVGHSLGGAVALAFAERYPERVERLVLVDSAGLGTEIDSETLDLMGSAPTPEHIQAELTRFFADPKLAQQSLVSQIQQQRSQPGAHDALLATRNAAFRGGQQRYDLRATLAALSIPTLITWGEADSVIPAAHAAAARQETNARVEIFARCGHCPHIERSEEFNRMVIAFLEEDERAR